MSRSKEAKKNFSEIKKEEKQIKLEQKKEEIKAIEKKSIQNKPKVSLAPAVQFLSNYKNNSIDCLMTDPPYSTDVKDIDKFVNEWLPLALSKVKKRRSRLYLYWRLSKRNQCLSECIFKSKKIHSR